MKTTIELPDPLFRKVKATAAERGQSLKDFLTEALREKLALELGGTRGEDPRWMQGFGKLNRLRHETARVQKVIEETFEILEPEDEG